MADFYLECPDSCTFREGQPWSKEISAMLLDGTSYRKVVAAAAQEGIRTNLATLSRHRKHIVLSGQGPEPESPKATNIEILETIIQKGFGNSKNWKPTISDTMKAMDMWFRLTQGNPFDDLLDTLAAASLGEEEPEEANPAAVSLPDEMEDVIDPEG
jgi:hypothetical protein